MKKKCRLMLFVTIAICYFIFACYKYLRVLQFENDLLKTIVAAKSEFFIDL